VRIFPRLIHREELKKAESPTKFPLGFFRQILRIEFLRLQLFKGMTDQNKG